MTWKKGESGNRRGRPKTDKTIQELALKHSEDAFEKIVWLMDNSEDDKIVLQAAEKILDRAYGRAPQAIEFPNGGEGGPFKPVLNITIKK